MTSTTKRCPRCQTVKPVSDYYRNSARKDGVGVYCRHCQCEVDDAREKRQRAELLSMLGGRCVSCGYNADARALHVDHVNGGGSGERSSGQHSYPAGLIRQVKASPDKFQLLCANCNIIKKSEQGEYVGSRVYEREQLAVRVLQRGQFTTKFCPRCRTEKSTTEFFRSRDRSDGLSGWCRGCAREVNADLARRQRGDLLLVLGGCCKACGFANPLALQVDHVNGDGAEDRRSRTNGHALTLLRLVLENPSAYQLLCANCNAIKRIEGKEHKGRRVYERTVLTTRTLKGHAHLGAARAAAADERLAELVALIAERRPVETSLVRLPQGSWSRFCRRCLGCGRSDRRHAAEGTCVACYSKTKGYTRRIPRADP